ncbi:MAG: glutathione-disulfide reductase [Rhodospirillaceae bacterium]|nr:glutathione-disulfide reductase [Rhodospirillaceae bacterium]
MRRFDYDLITLGAGSGGVRASRMAGRYGAKVAVVEASRIGGTCVMRGCVPKKLLVIGAHFGDAFEDARGFGWTVDGARHDWPAMIAAKNRELDRLEVVYRNLLKNAGNDLIEGRGVLADAHTVEVTGRRLTAERILVATGGWPVMPDIPGRELMITSNEALDLPDRPDRVVIWGGGYIAVEFAGIFRALGSEVHLVIRSDRVLRGFDGDVRTHLQGELVKKGIKVHIHSRVIGVSRANGALTATLDNGLALPANAVLCATGRAPNTAGLGLAEAGVALNEHGAVAVDDFSRSSVPHIFALGDVTDRINLTPVAINEGRMFAETQFNNTPMQMDYTNVASAVFSQPPVSVVGLSEEDARAAGHDVAVFRTSFRPMKHTLSGRDERTLMKLVVDKPTDRVLGCHMVGEDAPEIIQGLAVALKCRATKAQFDATIGIHPTAAEEFVTLREPVVLPVPGGENR